MDRIPFVFSGPSGVGKGTLIPMLMAEVLGLGFCVSHTTRPPRPNERDGEHCFFVGLDEFTRMKDAGEFVECAEVHGKWYGTSVKSLEAVLGSGRDVILDIDVQGQEQVKRKRSDAVSIFITPPSYRELVLRLSERTRLDKQKMRDQGKEVDEDKFAVDFARRVANSRGELEHFLMYDYVVQNDELPRALGDLKAIINVERAKRHGRSWHVSAADKVRAAALTELAMTERTELLLREFPSK